MELAITVEGQFGLNWTNWKKVVLAAEELGFVAVFRSDHFSSFDGPPDFDALECWVSLTWLACNTRRIQFGPLVSPVTFRHPAVTARMAANLDDLSEGRLILGLGTGWAKREHDIWGFDLGDLMTRFDRFEEGLELIYRLFHSDLPVTMDGRFYSVKGAQLLPKPIRPGGPQILVGGKGGRKTLDLAVRYADEWNTYLMTAKDVRVLSARLDKALTEHHHAPSSIRRSVMVNVVVGRSDAEVKRRMGGLSEAECRAIGVIGTPNAVVDQLAEYAAAGMYRVIAQMNDPNDMDFVEILGNEVIPQLK